MRTLKKMTIGELQIDSNEVLERERMKAIKGGGGGCYIYCSSTTFYITQNCDGNLCEGSTWACAGSC